MLTGRLVHRFPLGAIRTNCPVPIKGSRLSSIGQQRPMYIFDRPAKRMQRNRYASVEDPHTYDYIRDEIASRLADRVSDICRRFPVTVDLGCGRGHLLKYLTSESVDLLCHCDGALDVLKQTPSFGDFSVCRLNADEESFPFRSNSLDLVLSCLSLHWVNDLPGTLKEVLRSLKKDGCFLGVTYASGTLCELRISLQLAELERKGGFAPHISPFTDNIDMGELLYRTGFSLIALDVDEVVIHYPNLFSLLEDLRCMGESSAAFSRPLHLSRDVLLAASAIYDDKFSEVRRGGEPGERCIPATYRLLYFIGWKPDPSQRKPLPRGSAQFSLKDINRIDEIAREAEEKYASQYGDGKDPDWKGTS